MQSSICISCKSLSRPSMLSVLLLCFTLLSVTYAKNLPEQLCKPRPTVVAVHDSHGYKPYHVQLHRCSGTCNNKTPKLTACTASQEKSIQLNVMDPSTGEKTTIEVKNHTACDCDCNVQCNEQAGEFKDDKTCKCISIVGPKTGRRQDNKTAEEISVAVLPYKIGMAVVGFFALCVLVVDMMMCSKRVGVLHAVKTGCCESGDKTDGSYHMNGTSQKSPSTKVQVVKL